MSHLSAYGDRDGVLNRPKRIHPRSHPHVRGVNLYSTPSGPQTFWNSATVIKGCLPRSHVEQQTPVERPAIPPGVATRCQSLSMAERMLCTTLAAMGGALEGKPILRCRREV